MHKWYSMHFAASHKITQTVHNLALISHCSSIFLIYIYIYIYIYTTKESRWRSLYQIISCYFTSESLKIWNVTSTDVYFSINWSMLASDEITLFRVMHVCSINKHSLIDLRRNSGNITNDIDIVFLPLHVLYAIANYLSSI